jgi:hypothetical protein
MAAGVVALGVGLAACWSAAGALAGGAAPSRVLAPPVGALFSYQIGGAFEPERGVRIVDRDRQAQPARGFYNICYINAFQAQPAERSWWLAHHSDLLLFRHGQAVVDRGWHEQLLDTSTATKRRALARILGGWITGCARAGFRAIEPDNLDSWERSEGILTAADNLALAASLIAHAHTSGLAIAQKNAAGEAITGRRLGFDFAIVEECQPYAECAAYTRAYGREVIEIEYPDNGGPQAFMAACRARGARISLVYRDRDVTPAGDPGFIEQHCS